MKPKKLDCLEGVRALACIGVVLCHLKGAFLPHLRLAEILSSTPLYYLYSGNTAVRIMFMLSGFVLSYKYFRTGQTATLEKDVIKRYIRLMFPAAFMTLLVCAMMKLHLLYNVEASGLVDLGNLLENFYRFEPQFGNAAWEGFIGILLAHNSNYDPPLWTMASELFGSYLIFAAVALLKSKRVRYSFYVCFLLVFPAYYIYFVLGMMICDLYTHEEGLNRFLEKHGILTVVLHAAAWWYIGTVNNLDYFKWKNLIFEAAGAVMFLTLLNSSVLDRIWGNKAAVAIGKHGFSIYLIHWPVIVSFSSFYLCRMTALAYGRRTILLTDIVLTIVMIMALSVLFTKWVVQPSNRLSDRLAAWLVSPDAGASAPDRNCS